MRDEFRTVVKNKRRQKTWSGIILFGLIAVGIISLFWYRSTGGFNGEGEPGKVYIEINCSELMEHPGYLDDDSLWGYIPEDGVILKRTEVDIVKGRTNVFRVLDEACRRKDIQIEYNYVPAYGSHYVEGINYLYEFSAGKYSGWVFTVDGEMPNYGADDVVLKGGEEIVWSYIVDYR